MQAGTLGEDHRASALTFAGSMSPGSGQVVGQFVTRQRQQIQPAMLGVHSRCARARCVESALLGWARPSRSA